MGLAMIPLTLDVAILNGLARRTRLELLAAIFLGFTARSTYLGIGFFQYFPWIHFARLVGQDNYYGWTRLQLEYCSVAPLLRCCVAVLSCVDVDS